MVFPPHKPMTFHKGIVTNDKGNPSQTEAYVTYGSAHGQNKEDAEIVISGRGANKAAAAIEAIPDLISACTEARKFVSLKHGDPRNASDIEKILSAAIDKVNG